MIKNVVLQYVKTEQKTSQNGKPYKACSIKVADRWLNGFGNAETEKWQAGDNVTIDIYQEEWNGKIYDRFKTVDKADMLEIRVKKLEDAVFDKAPEVPKPPDYEDLPF